MEEQLYRRIMTREGYAYEPVESVPLRGYVQPKEDCDHPVQTLKLIHGFLCRYCGTIWNDATTKITNEKLKEWFDKKTVDFEEIK
jgi:hypothetical protein